MSQNIDFQEALNGIPHAIILIDGSLRLTGMNRQAEALTGRDIADVAGVRADFILRSDLHPFESTLAPVFGHGKSFSREGNLIDRNRKIVRMRFWISPLGSVDGQESGEVIGAMIVLEDLSHNIALEEKRGGFEALGAVASLSPKIQEVIDQIPVFAGTDASVLIEGETGTGHGLAAQTIHQSSKRSGYSFIKVNCGGMPESLLESELFGHARGAFDTADRERQGMLRLADGGTIFFSEIGDMPLSLQAKLLSVLDEGGFSPLGSTKKVVVDVRIISATSRDLKALVSEGRFREDLFYRLNVLRLHLPPVRERAEDIPLLINHFLKSFSPGNTVPEVEPEALRVLKDYSYPGNVRELRNVVEHAVTLSRGGKIGLQHLPEYLLQPGAGAAPGGFLTSSVRSASDDRSVKWDDVEKDMILDALRQACGRRKDAAKILGWARSTLYRKLKYHGI